MYLQYCCMYGKQYSVLSVPIRRIITVILMPYLKSEDQDQTTHPAHCNDYSCWQIYIYFTVQIVDMNPMYTIPWVHLLTFDSYENWSSSPCSKRFSKFNLLVVSESASNVFKSRFFRLPLQKEQAVIIKRCTTCEPYLQCWSACKSAQSDQDLWFTSIHSIESNNPVAG